MASLQAAGQNGPLEDPAEGKKEHKEQALGQEAARVGVEARKGHPIHSILPDRQCATAAR